jgi:uncharacterized protein YndB with AHSA1/START domain
MVATCAYDTNLDDVWDAITNAGRIPRWFLPISGDLRLGGRYQLEGNAGGTITACEPPRHLALTWEFGGQVTWVRVQLQELSDGGTLLRLEHIAQVPDELWNQYGPGAVGVGWDLTLMGLGRNLSTRESNNPQQAAAWAKSEEGKEFVRQSSHEWSKASISSGTDEAAALSAANRTLAFYTGDARI